MPLKTLKPRIQVADSKLQPLQPTSRMTGRRLQERRERKRQENPLCRPCLERGEVRVWTQLHHEVPLWQGGSDTDENTEGLCDACHEAQHHGERVGG
jgi:5-methylcytosine-specific restriction enzyme A